MIINVKTLLMALALDEGTPFYSTIFLTHGRAPAIKTARKTCRPTFQ